VYLAAGKFGLSLASVHPLTSAVWPPTGIAIAALLLFGLRLWPGVFFGAFLVNLTTADAVPISLGIAAGNTLEAVVAYLLVTRFARGARAFETGRDLLLFVFLAGLFSTAISASIGTFSIIAGGGAPWVRAREIWITWWLGDAVGAIVVTPFLVLLARPTASVNFRKRGVELVLFTASVVFVCGIVFNGWFHPQAPNVPLAFLIFPIFVWAGFRFSPREAAASSVLVSTLAIRGTMSGFGPFVRSSENASLLLLQAFVAVASVITLAVAALVAERRRIEDQVRTLNDALEERVAARTAELSAAQAKLVEAQDLAHVGSWEWDIRGDRVWWSPELYRIYGLTPETASVSYEAYLGRVHPADRDLVDRAVKAALQDRRPFGVEHAVVRPDGTQRIVYGQGRVITDEAGEPVRMVGATQDITERREAERQRTELAAAQTARRNAEEANRAKDEFLATLSHELRTPLTAILGWITLLQDKKHDEATRRALAIIDRNTRVQARVVGDLLDVSQIITGRMTVRREPTDLTAIVASAIEAARPSAEQRHLALGAELPPSAVPIVGDAARLHQAVSNVLANAIKFTDEGAVNVTMRRRGGVIEIEVADTGIGVRPEVLPLVFERFRQGDSSITRQHGGLGLGLAIVRHIFELHGGAVSIHSEGVGRGTVVRMTLPAVERIGPDVAARPREPARTLKGMHVLAVEDQPDTLELIIMSLQSAGATVEGASTVRAALEALQRRRADVFVVDIGLPDEDGYSFLRQARARGHQAPALALTAYASAEDQRRALQEGFQAHMAKPFLPTDLIAVLATLKT